MSSRRYRSRGAWFIAGLCLLPAPILAQTFLLTGATVHTVAGDTLSPGQVLVRDGKIAAVGSALEAAGAPRVDLQGQHLYPGMIALDSVLGLTEIDAVRATADSTEVGEFTPDVESWVAVNPDSELIPVARANGIACFEAVPTGGIVAGQSGLVTVEGWTTEQRTIKKPVALHVFWPNFDLDLSPRDRARGRTRAKPIEEQAKDRQARLESVTEFFAEGRAYARAKAAAAKGLAASPKPAPAWEALVPFVRGDLPIAIHANEVRQIKSAVAWATTNHYKMLLVGARDAWRVAELLAEKRVPVVYEHVFTLPVRDTDSYDVPFTAPKVLHEAGVLVAFSLGPRTFDAPQSRNLPYAAAQAVAFGLPPAEALKGLTLYPAEFAGVADRLGSIEVGKDATLMATDGDLLDIRANVKHLWLAGKELDLSTRHTRLYDRYRNRPGSP